MCVKLRFFGFACTAEVQQFVPPIEVGMDVLSPEEDEILQKTMHRLTERVCECGCGWDGVWVGVCGWVCVGGCGGEEGW